MFGKYKKKYKIAQAKLDLLAHQRVFDVNSFNKWFCDDSKPKEIYAHSGIFLRIDKLCHDNIIDYWCSLTDMPRTLVTELSYEHYFIVNKFEAMITRDWFRRQNK